jgi:hypothetical protein
MKNLYLVLVFAVASSSLLYSQNPDEVSVLDSRPIAVSTESWTSGTWVEQDSSHFTYSGTRGGTAQSTIVEGDFDVNQGWLWIGGVKTNYKLYENTYDANNRKTQEVTKTWNNAAWENEFRETLTYSAQGLTNLLYEQWNGSAWVGSYRRFYTLDASGNLLIAQRDNYSGGAWIGIEKNTFTYNTDNQVLVATFQDFVGGNWENDLRNTNTYDVNGNLIGVINEQWNTGTNTWQFYGKRIFTYTAANLLQSETFQNYTGGNWVDNYRSTNSYNAQNHIIEYFFEQYSNGTWQNSQKTTYAPNSAGLDTETLVYNWSGGTWVENSRILRTFNASGGLLTYLNSYYSNGTWNDGYNSVYTYNSDNDLLTLLYQEDFGSGLQNVNRKFYYYESYEDGTNGITTIPTLTSTVLPNPFTINVAIQVNATATGNHTFEVYNMAGQRVHSESRYFTPGAQTIVWEGGEVPKGVYFYKINSQSGVASGKLVKQ